jgi:hypothetical protein
LGLVIAFALFNVMLVVQQIVVLHRELRSQAADPATLSSLDAVWCSFK